VVEGKWRQISAVTYVDESDEVLPWSCEVKDTEGFDRLRLEYTLRIALHPRAMLPRLEHVGHSSDSVDLGVAELTEPLPLVMRLCFDLKTVV